MRDAGLDDRGVSDEWTIRRELKYNEKKISSINFDIDVQHVQSAFLKKKIQYRL